MAHDPAYAGAREPVWLQQSNSALLGAFGPVVENDLLGHGKLAGVTGWIEARVAAKGEITLDELAVELAETHGIEVHRGTIWRVLRGLGLTHEKRPAGA
ncbi:hypothetical protein [Rhodovulum sp. ES.010]|uniref:hypothetical protein n=1 Tax=Rhodovulum sp. ES.010 TaxID=1882821 RepID=UPI00094178F0|nr:hypothetical protein [Rhodovulum sp. ES.010]